MFNKKLILGIMLLGLVGSNDTKAMQLNTINTQVNNSESSNFKSNKNILKYLWEDLFEFTKTFGKDFNYQTRNIDDKELVKNCEEIQQEYKSYAENELTWVVDTFVKFSDSPNEITKEIVDKLSERIEIFKNKVLN